MAGMVDVMLTTTLGGTGMECRTHSPIPFRIAMARAFHSRSVTMANGMLPLARAWGAAAILALAQAVRSARLGSPSSWLPWPSWVPTSLPLWPQSSPHLRLCG